MRRAPCQARSRRSSRAPRRGMARRSRARPSRRDRCPRRLRSLESHSQEPPSSCPSPTPHVVPSSPGSAPSRPSATTTPRSGPTRRRRERRRPHHPLRRLRPRRAHRRRGQGLRSDGRHGPQDGPPHEPLHPPRHGRRQGGRRGRGARLRGLEPGAARSGRGGGQHVGRRHGAGHRGQRHHQHQGPALRQPLRHPGPVGLDGGLPALDGVRPHGAGHHPGRGLRLLASSASSTGCA